MNARVLSLFNGMACGMLAFMSAGVEVESYDSYEIDKYAVQTATHNFPIIAEHGDVFTADFTQYEGVDFLIGGSPCTYWSIAQTKNRETVASGMGWELFSQYVRALNEAKPKYFIYENNKSMSKEIRASIDETFGFEAVCINSALVSAQNRQRLYWVGKRNEDGTYSRVNVEQPEDRGILLKDVLDGACAWRDKAYAVIASATRECFIKNQGNMVAEPVCVASRGRNPDDPSDRTAGAPTEQGRTTRFEAHEDGKTNTLTSVSKDNLIAEPVQVGRMPREDGAVTDSKQYRVYGVDGKAVTQCGQGGGLGAKTGLYAEPVLFQTPRGANKGGCLYNKSPTMTSRGSWENNVKLIQKADGTDGKAITVYEVCDGKITIKGKQYPIKLRDGFYIIRKLTVSECKRLQTVPEWYEFPVSNSQAYKMLGNGWTVEVIAHLVRAALSGKVCGEERQLNLFEED